MMRAVAIMVSESVSGGSVKPPYSGSVKPPYSGSVSGVGGASGGYDASALLCYVKRLAMLCKAPCFFNKTFFKTLFISIFVFCGMFYLCFIFVECFLTLISVF